MEGIVHSLHTHFLSSLRFLLLSPLKFIRFLFFFKSTSLDSHKISGHSVPDEWSSLGQASPTALAEGQGREQTLHVLAAMGGCEERDRVQRERADDLGTLSGMYLPYILY